MLKQHQEISEQSPTPRTETVTYPDRTLAQGSLWNTIWKQSWPLVIATVCSSLIGTADVQVAGLIGPSAQASVGLAEHIIFMFNIFVLAIGVGTTAIVSRRWGENDRSGAAHATAQSLSFSVMLGSFLAVMATIGANWLVPLFAEDKHVVSQSVLYLSLYALYLVPFSMVCICNAAFRAIGNARITALIVFTELVINIAGDYATVVGNWPVAGLGIRGIAYSSIAAAVCAALIAVIVLLRSPLRRSMTLLFPISVVAIRRVFRIGLPSALHGLGWALSLFVVFLILKQVENSTAALASWTIGTRIDAILFTPLLALRLAVGATVGQSLGAKDPARAFRAGWLVSAAGAALMLVVSLVVFALARPIAGIFTSDTNTIEYVVSFLRIGAISYPFLGMDAVLSGALQGAGDTEGLMWILLFTNWVIRLPLAWMLCVAAAWGPTGAWAAVAVSAIMASLMIAKRFYGGSWTRLEV